MKFATMDVSSPSQRKQFGEKCITTDGVRVRSKSEKKIADFLVSRGIKYEYEKMARTWALGSKIGFPDFYLPAYKIYVEYWGLAEDNNYNQNMRRKMAKYNAAGLKCINLYTFDLDHLDQSLPRKFREATGLDFPAVQKSAQTP